MRLEAATGIRRRVVIAAAVSVLAVLALAGYLLWPSSTPAAKPTGSLRVPGFGTGDKVGISAIYKPKAQSFGSIPLCVGSSPATITSLVPQGGNGQLMILDYATRLPTAGMFGASQRTLAQEGFAPSKTVDVACTAVLPDELGITVARTGTGNGRFESLRVNYDQAGKHESLVIPFLLKICGPDGRTTETCGDAQSP